MNIGIEANSYYKNTAGSGVFTRNIIDELKKFDNEARVFLFANNRHSEMDITKKKNIFRRIYNGIYDIFWMQVLLPIKLKQNKIDVLYCPAYLGPIFAPCPVVLTLFDMNYKRYPQTCDFMFRKYLQFLLPITKKSAKKIITISEFSKSEIVSLLNIDPSKIEIILLGAHEKFRCNKNQIEIEKVKTKYGISGDFILTVGTLEPRKNMAKLVDAFNIIKKDLNIKHKLVICGGKGWYYDNIFTTIKDNGLEKEIVFTGYVDDEDLPVLYSAADIFAFPSIYEGFGLPVLEAMSCGCPVVASNTSSIPEVTGDAAVLVTPFDSNDIAKGLLQVINNMDFKNELIKKGLERSKIFSWHSAAKKLLNIFKTTINDNN